MLYYYALLSAIPYNMHTLYLWTLCNSNEIDLFNFRKIVLMELEWLHRWKIDSR